MAIVGGYILVILIGISLWFVLSPSFKKLGKLVSKFYQNLFK